MSENYENKNDDCLMAALIHTSECATPHLLYPLKSFFFKANKMAII